MEQGGKRDRFIKFLRRHQRIVRMIAGMMMFLIALFLVGFAYQVYAQAAGNYAGYFVIGTLMLIWAAGAWRSATDFHDWEQNPEYQHQIDSLSEEIEDLKKYITF